MILGKLKGVWLGLVILLLGAAACGCAAAPEQEPADAEAGVPVYLNGPFVEDGKWRGSSAIYERIAYAEVVDGRTFVPLEAVFEACEAEVSLEVDRITAETVEGAGITVQVGSTLAEIDGQEVELAAAPFRQEGEVMVPLRFVGEALGFGVDWRDDGRYLGFDRSSADSANGDAVYLTRSGAKNGSAIVRRAGTVWEDFCFSNGAVCRLYCDGGRIALIDEDGETELGRLDLSVLEGNGAQFRGWWGFEAKRTPRGRWQVSATAMVTGATTCDLIFRAWLAPELGRAYGTNYIYDDPYNRQEPLWIEGAGGRGEIVLPGDGEALIINDESGELVQRLEGSILRWADAGHVLFGVGDEWELVDRQTEERRDLTRELLSAENRLRLEAQVRRCLSDLDESDWEHLWEGMGKTLNQDMHAHLDYLGEEKGVLRFSLSVWNMPPLKEGMDYPKLKLGIEI